MSSGLTLDSFNTNGTSRERSGRTNSGLLRIAESSVLSASRRFSMLVSFSIVINILVSIGLSTSSKDSSASANVKRVACMTNPLVVASGSRSRFFQNAKVSRTLSALDHVRAHLNYWQECFWLNNRDSANTLCSNSLVVLCFGSRKKPIPYITNVGRNIDFGPPCIL